MKLVDILARELKVWPEGVLYAWQSECDNEVYFEGAHAEIFYASVNAHDSGSEGSTVRRNEWQAAVDALKAEKVTVQTIANSKYVNDPRMHAAGDAAFERMNKFFGEWNGEGLPPVGIDARLKKECKFTEGTRLDSFPAGTIVYVGGHANFGGCDLAVIIIKGRHFCGTIIPELLEPFRTPEQIAEEERERAIGAMQKIASEIAVMERTKLLGALYDAGYRKFEIVDN